MKPHPRTMQTDHLVMVIHGVGDPAPGETLSLFARSIAGPRQPLSENQEVVWLDEKSSQPEYVQRFATHVRHLELGDERAVLTEVFWGDLSRVRQGLAGAALGLVEILFGLQFVAYAAARQPGRTAWLIRHLGRIAAAVLHGPALAVTFVLAVLALALAGTELIWPQSWRGVLWSQVLMSAICGMNLLLARVGRAVSRHEGAQQFWHWVEVTSAFLAGVVFLKGLVIDPALPELAFTGSVRPGLVWYCRILVWMLGLLWLVQMLVVIAMGVAWLAGVFRAAASRRSLHVAVLVPSLVIGFWGLLLPMLWLLAARTLRRVAALDEFDSLFAEASPMLGVQLLMAGLVVMVAGAVLVRYCIWRGGQLAAGRNDPALRRGRTPAPRLIVHPTMQFAAGVSTLAGVCLIATLNILQMAGRPIHEMYLGRVLEQANSYAVGALMPGALFGLMLFPHLRPVLDIVLDVVNHFYFRETTIHDALDPDEYDIRETTFDDSRFYFARRDRIHARIKNSLSWFRDQLDCRPALTLICHSQGTMIGIEVLNDPELAWLNRQFSSVRLVTMGSPFTHLYQHYFPQLYPELDDPHWEELRGRLSRWINICRDDDFVGTTIRFPDPATEFGRKCGNFPVGYRGHLNYWSDVAVLQILRRELLNSGDAQATQAIPMRRAA